MRAQNYSGSKQDEKPPEYCETWPQNGHPRATTSDVIGLHTSTATMPAPTVTQLHLFTKHEDIKGTFYIDASAPRLTNTSKAEKKILGNCQASFRSRKGKIAIDVGTSGRGPQASGVVWSRKGDVHVNILPLLPDRPRISLDVSSRKGNVVLFIPDSYRGIIQLSTAKGKLDFLPALSATMQTYKMAPKEALVFVGASSPNQPGDFCRISTKSGEIVVGMAGRDRYPGESGLLKLLGNAIHQLIR